MDFYLGVFYLGKKAEPLPMPSNTCMDKSLNGSSKCFDQVQKKWNVTGDQLEDGKIPSPPLENFCCGNYLLYDCMLAVTKVF